ncbi:serine/threonine-protein kinase PK-1 [bacterium BMS3Bbin06]|nr:serine/threonine-protein kinase PK-1 [bacterium BMS3Abin08]GBE34897.1 serine/threonine-protein kinase PK-1 [bacterium BMS3Bbin06]
MIWTVFSLQYFLCTDLLMKTIFKITLYFTLFLVLTVFSSYVTFRIMGAKKTVAVPDLRKKNLIEANKEIMERRLYIKIDGEEFNQTLPAGTIIRQEIPPRERIKQGRTIRVIISKGPKRYYMPDFIGLNVDEARDLAIKNNLKIKRILRARSDAYEKDTVIGQRPTPDERGADRVSLLVSNGPFDVLYSCPDFAGMSLSAAKELVEKMGLEIELSGYGSRIVGQKPAAGSIIKRGDLIKLKLEHKEEQRLRWL